MHVLDKFITTPKAQQDRLIKRYRVCSGHHLLRESLLDLAQEKIRGDVASGELEMKLIEPERVTITYHDRGNSKETITTIAKIALVGEVQTKQGFNVKLVQNWVGRVFPQWKAFSSPLEEVKS